MHNGVLDYDGSSEPSTQNLGQKNGDRVEKLN